MSRLWATALLLCFSLGCREKEGPRVAVAFSGADAFGDAAVVDVVFVVQNVEESGLILDLDGDGLPDLFVFPKTCGASPPAGCGYPASTPGDVDLGTLPLNFLYEVEVRFRNAAGATLYSGTTNYRADPATTSLSVAVVKAST